ncbi:hypothetical protein Tco_0943869 [Tanacetum coccineum]
MKIMINEESSDSNISDFEENDLNIVENESTSSNESEECECIGNCTCDYKEINTIQEDDEIKRLSDLIGRVEDNELRKMYLDRLKEQLRKPKTIDRVKEQDERIYNFDEIDFSLEYPRWFIQWFQYFGIIPESFPPKILAGYEHFKELFKQEEAPMFEYTLQFAAVFKLPWIMSFNHKKQERQGNFPPSLIRQFSVKWWKQIEDKQASKEAVIRYYNDITAGSPSPSSSTRSIIKDDSDDIARRIRDCKEEDLARIIKEIRSSPSTSEDLFQDSQDPYDM